MRRAVLIALGLVAVALIVAACGGSEVKDTGPNTIVGEVEAPEIAIGDAANGAAVFVSAGCGGCHMLDGVEGATGAVGPNLTESLAGKDPAYVQQGIVSPDVVVVEGFTAGVMPGTYRDQLSANEIADLVAVMLENAGG